MYLSQLVGKTLFVGNAPRGVCLGVGVSLKTQRVRYLLCAGNANARTADFAINASSILRTNETGIYLSRLRAVFPQNCAKLFPKLPVYTQNGVFLGCITDLKMPSFCAECVFTDTGEKIPVSCVTACLDAVIVRKAPVYPLGQRIPAPVLSFENAGTTVTRPLLKKAVERGELIKLTLSLPPFTTTAR